MDYISFLMFLMGVMRTFFVLDAIQNLERGFKE